MLTHKDTPVTYRDGTTGTARVNALPLSKLEEFICKQHDPDVVLSLCVDGDITSLTTESQLDLVAVADELNDPLARRFLSRQEALVSRYEQKANPAPSPTSPPASLPVGVVKRGTLPPLSPGPKPKP